MVVNPRTLDKGLYRFTLKVQMVSSEFSKQDDFSSEMTVYVEVTDSQLIAALAQSAQTFITRGHDEIVTLDAAKYSWDPDVSSTPGGPDQVLDNTTILKNIYI